VINLHPLVLGETGNLDHQANADKKSIGLLTEYSRYPLRSGNSAFRTSIVRPHSSSRYIRHIATDRVAWCVCRSVIHDRDRCNTSEPIKMLYMDLGRTKDYVSYGSPDLRSRRGNFEGEMGPVQDGRYTQRNSWMQRRNGAVADWVYGVHIGATWRR